MITIIQQRIKQHQHENYQQLKASNICSYIHKRNIHVIYLSITEKNRKMMSDGRAMKLMAMRFDRIVCCITLKVSRRRLKIGELNNNVSDECRIEKKNSGHNTCEYIKRHQLSLQKETNAAMKNEFSQLHEENFIFIF